MKRFRWIISAGAAGLLLLALFVIFRPESTPSGPGAVLPVWQYASVQNSAGRVTLTPFGTVTHSNPSSDTSIVFGPVLSLAEPLKLSPDQMTRITAAQQQAQKQVSQERIRAEKAQADMFRKIRQTQQTFTRPIPLSDPVSQQVNMTVQRMTAAWRMRQMRNLFGQISSTERENSKKLRTLEENGANAVEAVLNESQKAALPRLLAEMQNFRTLSLQPAERYVMLDLSGEQKYRIAALARRVKNQQNQSMRTILNQFRQQSSSMRSVPPLQRRTLLLQRSADHRRAFQNGLKTRDQIRRKARNEALAMLTETQRQAIGQPIQTRPPRIFPL